MLNWYFLTCWEYVMQEHGTALLVCQVQSVLKIPLHRPTNFSSGQNSCWLYTGTIFQTPNGYFWTKSLLKIARKTGPAATVSFLYGVTKVLVYNFMFNNGRPWLARCCWAFFQQGQQLKVVSLGLIQMFSHQGLLCARSRSEFCSVAV